MLGRVTGESDWSAEREGVNKDMECHKSEEIIEYDIMWGTEEKFVKDEVVRDEGEETDGCPRIGRSHR